MNLPKSPTFSFVVPLYNTGAGLDPLLSAFQDAAIEESFELVLVNDGSPDGTGDRVPSRIQNRSFPIVFVDLTRNFGEHAAVLGGLRRTQGEFAVTLDDDLQNPIDEALRLLRHLRSSSLDVVYACYEEKKHHWFRNLGSWMTNWVATWLLGKPRDLYLCSFRAMRRGLVRDVTAYRGPYPYIDGLILGATQRIGTLLVRHEERSAGASGYTLRRLVRLWMNMFFNFSIMPLRVASLLGGALLSGSGIVGLLLVLVELAVEGIRVPGWASLMATISIFSGAQLMMLGVIGEYVGRAFMTVSGKPQSLVRSVVAAEPGLAPEAATVSSEEAPA
jgi:undecaprenyl-phosphate 4-deoxy-4-formamido-L-arabinose transferase